MSTKIKYLRILAFIFIVFSSSFCKAQNEDCNGPKGKSEKIRVLGEGHCAILCAASDLCSTYVFTHNNKSCQFVDKFSDNILAEDILLNDESSVARLAIDRGDNADAQVGQSRNLGACKFGARSAPKQGPLR